MSGTAVLSTATCKWSSGPSIRDCCEHSDTLLTLCRHSVNTLSTQNKYEIHVTLMELLLGFLINNDVDMAPQSPVCTWCVIWTYGFFLLYLFLCNLLYIILHDAMIMQDFLILVDHSLAGSDSPDFKQNSSGLSARQITKADHREKKKILSYLKLNQSNGLTDVCWKLDWCLQLWVHWYNSKVAGWSLWHLIVLTQCCITPVHNLLLLR